MAGVRSKLDGSGLGDDEEGDDGDVYEFDGDDGEDDGGGDDYVDNGDAGEKNLQRRRHELLPR